MYTRFLLPLIVAVAILPLAMGEESPPSLDLLTRKISIHLTRAGLDDAATELTRSTKNELTIEVTPEAQQRSIGKALTLHADSVSVRTVMIAFARQYDIQIQTIRKDAFKLTLPMHDSDETVMTVYQFNDPQRVMFGALQFYMKGAVLPRDFEINMLRENEDGERHMMVNAPHSIHNDIREIYQAVEYGRTSLGVNHEVLKSMFHDKVAVKFHGTYYELIDYVNERWLQHNMKRWPIVLDETVIEIDGNYNLPAVLDRMCSTYKLSWYRANSGVFIIAPSEIAKCEADMARSKFNIYNLQGCSDKTLEDVEAIIHKEGLPCFKVNNFMMLFTNTTQHNCITDRIANYRDANTAQE